MAAIRVAASRQATRVGPATHSPAVSPSCAGAARCPGAEDLQAIVKGLIDAARQGDVAAARLVLAYSLGKPGPTVDPDAIDLNEWQLWQQMGADSKAMASLFGGMHVPLACEVMRTLLPALQDVTRQQVADTMAVATPGPDLAHPANPSADRPEEPAPSPPAPRSATPTTGSSTGHAADPETTNGCAEPSAPRCKRRLR